MARRRRKSFGEPATQHSALLRATVIDAREAIEAVSTRRHCEDAVSAFGRAARLTGMAVAHEESGGKSLAVSAQNLREDLRGAERQVVAVCKRRKY